MFTHHFKRAFDNDKDYLNAMNEFLQPLSDSKQSREEIVKSGVLDYWISFTTTFVDKETTTDNDTIMALISK
jgi:uncharacterized protein (UPF0332 family)